MHLNKIEGIIFDLDDTLFDCTGQLTGAARQRAAEVIVFQCPTLDKNTLILAQEEHAQTLGSAGALIKIGQEHDLPPELIDRARDAYNIDIVENITPFPDTHKTLDQLIERGYQLALVTSGSPTRQLRKIEQLNLAPYFSETNGNLVLHNDQISADKTPFIQQAAQQLQRPYNALLAVGDKLNAEIAAANSLGMQTVHMRHGRQKNRVPQTPDEHPDHQIDTLSQLIPLLS